MNFINCISNALSIHPGVPIFPRNGHYKWENGSSHEWLPLVTSVLDVSAGLPAILPSLATRTAVWNYYFSLILQLLHTGDRVNNSFHYRITEHPRLEGTLKDHLTQLTECTGPKGRLCSQNIDSHI